MFILVIWYLRKLYKFPKIHFETRIARRDPDLNTLENVQYTYINLFEILLNQIKIRLYLPCTD